MSIVPYNHNNKIVYHDPNYGLLVLHNNQENTIQLLSTNSTEVNGFRRSNENGHEKSERYYHIDDHNQCPNCGFVWNKYEKPERRHSNSQSFLFDTSTRESNSTLSKKIPPKFMHQDYFKLLSKLPYQSDGKFGKLPKEIYNQGYFDKFFVKIPPYILGSGAHSQVYKVMHVLNDIKLGIYALKRISIGDKFEFLEQVLNEVLILYELSAKGSNENNLIRYNHVWIELGDLDDSSSYILPDKGGSVNNAKLKIPYVFILQQYCDGGHLEDLINKNFQPEKKLSMKEKIQKERERRRSQRSGTDFNENENKKQWLSDFEIWKFFMDVAKGVHYLHSHSILHRDLKPSNCLLDMKYKKNSVPLKFETLLELEDFKSTLPNVLVSDFGEGKFLKKHNINEGLSINETNEDHERRGNTGTLEFTAPELWLIFSRDPNLENKGDKYIYEFTFESDIYSLGLILCWLCIGKLPFSEKIENEYDPKVIRDRIIDWYFNLDSKKFHDWFNSQISTRDNNNSGEFLNSFGNLIYLMIKGNYDQQKDAEVRISISEILSYLYELRNNFLIKKSHDLESVTSSSADFEYDKNFNNNGSDADSESDVDNEVINLLETKPIKSPDSSHIPHLNICPSSAISLQHIRISICIIYAVLLILTDYMSFQSIIKRRYVLTKCFMLISFMFNSLYPPNITLQLGILSINLVLLAAVFGT